MPSKPKHPIKAPAERKQRGGVDRSVMFPVAPPSSELPAGYADWFTDLKQRIHAERLRVVLASNAAMVMLYWDMGQRILAKQDAEGWGARIIDRLAADLRQAFPDMKGFSPRNLKYMRTFAAAWADPELVQRTVAQLPWGGAVNPSASPNGKPSSPSPCPITCAAACPRLKRSKPNWRRISRNSAGAGMREVNLRNHLFANGAFLMHVGEDVYRKHDFPIHVAVIRGRLGRLGYGV